MLDGKVLMITGGTGSFGNTVIDRFLQTDIGQIIVFSRDEKKQEDLRVRLKSSKVRFVIGDTRDAASVRKAMRGVDFVFQAAALKQVPSCEFYPMEAVRTNIIGTENVIEAAIDSGVQRVVLLSTDKAVYPINAMGLSKAMAEKVAVAAARVMPEGGPIICATRYGNVMASRGSVIPLFVERIINQQTLGITDPSMTRFMMSLADSVDLVMYAFTHGKQGDIFVQKAPACTVSNLAQALCELFKVPRDTKIIGTRHGEKVYETLVSREEMAKAEDMGRYWRVPADNRDLNYEIYLSQGSRSISDVQDYTSHNTNQLSVEETKKLLLTIPFIEQSIQTWFNAH